MIDEEDLEQEANAEGMDTLLEEEGELDEDEGNIQDEDGGTIPEAASEQEVYEAFAAGWKAKAKTAGVRKARGWSKGSPGSSSSSGRSLADKKRISTCSSCGQRGHWKGDSQCPNVLSGKDPPHKKLEPNIREVNFTNFTFMVGADDSGQLPPPACPSCKQPVSVNSKFCQECGEKLHSKRGWLVVGAGQDSSVATDEEQPPRPMRDIRIPKSALDKSSKSERVMKVKALEVLAAVDNFTKEDKKALKHLLQKDEDEERERQQLPLTSRRGSMTAASSSTTPLSSAAPMDPPYPQMLSSLAPEVAHSSTGLQPPSKKDHRGRDKAAAVFKRELDDFRVELWRASWDGRRTRASSGAPRPSEQQARCPHQWESLVWSANQHGHQARCKRCDLKNVLLWSCRHGVLAASSQTAPTSSSVALGQSVNPALSSGNGIPVGQVILDSGCRTAVAGWRWHLALQDELRRRNFGWIEVDEHETFQFGSGQPELSTKAFIYPAGVYGRNAAIRMSAVGGGADGCPGLVGPSELARWGTCFNFTTKAVQFFGEWHPMVLSMTRRPALNILNFAANSVDPLQGKDLAEQIQILKENPHSLAFVAMDDDGMDSVDSGRASEMEEEEETPPEPNFFGDFGECQRREKVQQWLDLLENDLGVKVIHDLPEAVGTGSEFSDCTSDKESISSHEFGLHREAMDSEEELISDDGKVNLDKSVAVDPDDEEELIPEKAPVKFFHKNMRKKVHGILRDVKYMAQTASTCSTATSSPRLSTLVAQQEESAASRPRRRPGPLRILEIFTWTMAVSFAAHQRGWEVGEPLTLPNYNLLDPEDQQKAFAYVRSFDPDFIMVAFPCTVWSGLQTFGFRSPEFLERLAARRDEQRGLLGWVQDVVLDHRSRGGAVLGENPLTSKAWKEPVVVDTWEGLPKQRTDMCAFGLRRPDGEWNPEARGLYLRKPTLLTGQEEILKRACRVCPGDHRHSPCLGGVRVEGRWCNLSDLAGGYTKKFAQAIVIGAEEFLTGRGSKRKLANSFIATPLLPEEVFMDDPLDFASSHLVPCHGTWAGQSQQSGNDHEDIEHNHQTTTGQGGAGQLDPTEPAEPSDQEDIKHNQQTTTGQGGLSQTDRMERLMMLHRRLGHPTAESLTRMLQHAGASDETVQMVQHLRCPACQLSKQPKRPHPSRPEVRAVVFNTCVHADLKYLHDYKHDVYVALSVVDEATNYHQAKLLKNRSPGHVAAKFMSMWIGLFGPPQSIRLDQGGEWESDFIQLLEAHSIHSEFVGSHSPWSNGYAERHGALLGIAMQATVEEQQLVGRIQMKLGLAAACQAKNSVISRGGHSAHFLLFGRQACFPELLDDDIWTRKSMGFALSTEGEVARACELRTAARISLLRSDVLEKIKRALRRAPAGERRQYTPGELVYFWSPAKPQDRRYKRGMGAWRGPAVVLVPDGAERYFVSWRGRCLLVSGANLKGATVEDANRHDLREEGAELDLAKGYVDLTEDSAPPEELEAPFSAEAPGLSVKRRRDGAGRKLSEARKMMSGLKSVKKILKGPLDPRLRRFRSRIRPRPPQASEEAGANEGENGVLPEAPAEVGGQSVEDDGGPWSEAPPAADLLPPPVEYDHLDDLPFQARLWQQRKRQRDEEADTEDQLKRLRTIEFANYVLTAVSEGELTGQELKANEWLPRREVEQLARLLDVPLSAARVHRRPRKRLQHPGPRGDKARLTVMYGQDPNQVLLAQESPGEVAQRPRRRCPHLWRGISFFLKRDRSHLAQGEVKAARALLRKKKGHGNKVFIAKENEVFAVNLANYELFEAAKQDLAENVLFMEALVLKMKASGKELDPRAFSPEERAAFDTSDAKEWAAWIENKVIEQLGSEEAKKVPSSRVFKVPARVVRTNKALPGAKELIAKSRIVLPGHLDPDCGSLRTDAPTTQMTAVRMAMTIGLMKKWAFWLFDVSTAFLSGKEVKRDLYCRPPGDLKCASAAVLWRILKSAYGLSEAPRLWYIQAKELLQRCGFEELAFAPATFVKRVRRVQTLVVVAILCLHVDDGFLTIENGRCSEETRKAIDGLFKIKEWIQVGEKASSYLGMQIYIKDGVFYNDMNGYILELKPAPILEKNEDSALGPASLKELRRLVAQLRWPVHLVLPEFLFQVSSLAQKVGNPKVKDLLAANELLTQVQAVARQGLALLRLQGLRGEPLLVTYFDASLGKASETAAQRGEVHFITDKNVLSGNGQGNILEYHSNKIARVVRSSMAAECCSMAAASDRLVYNLKLLEALLFGKLEVPATWRAELQVKGHLVSDAKSLFDHVNGSGQLATERQVSLDILAVRQAVQEKLLCLHWVPTWRQFADSLTKAMIDELFSKFRRTGLLNIIQTPADEVEETRRAVLRKAQRMRRKLRMKS